MKQLFFLPEAHNIKSLHKTVSSSYNLRINGDLSIRMIADALSA